jgi:hypothetical protein
MRWVMEPHKLQFFQIPMCVMIGDHRDKNIVKSEFQNLSRLAKPFLEFWF